MGIPFTGFGELMPDSSGAAALATKFFAAYAVHVVTGMPAAALHDHERPLCYSLWLSMASEGLYILPLMGRKSVVWAGR